eukprot:166371_1
MTWWNPKYVPPDLRKRAIHLYVQGETAHDISERLLVSESGVYRWYQTFAQTGEIWTAKEAAQRNGVYVKPHPNKITKNQAVRDALFAKLDESCVSTLKEYQETLLWNTGALASLSTIHRFWEDKDVTYKKCSIFAKESDPMDVLDFWSLYNCTVSDIDQVLWGDESHRNDHTSTRQYGRSHKSDRALQYNNLTKGGYKLSLEMFADATGPVVYDILHGSITSDDFVDFAWKYLYDYINPYPQNHSVIIIDNASIHHIQEWKEFVEETEIICIYLAQYCPWMNLCEWIFNGIKMVEKQKNVKGEWESLLSLSDSVETQKNKNWMKVLEHLNYCEKT